MSCCPACGGPLANHCRADGHTGRTCSWFRCLDKRCRAYGTAPDLARAPPQRRKDSMTVPTPAPPTTAPPRVSTPPSRARTVGGVIAGALAAAAAVVGVLAGGPSTDLGFYVSGQQSSAVSSLASSLHVTAQDDSVFASCSDTPGVGCTWNAYSGGLRPMLGVGDLTPGQASAIGNSLVKAGHADAFIRVMWEGNQDVGTTKGWFPGWNENAFKTPADWIAEFQQIVNTMRGVPGQHFVFLFNPDSGNWSGNQRAGWSNTAEWPGKAYVDGIGIDTYDNAAVKPNFLRWVAFAQQQGEPIALPEWGLHSTDDPGFIDWVHSVIVNAPGTCPNGCPHVLSQDYFNFDTNIRSRLSEFPQSMGAYVRDFSGSGPTPSTTSSTSPPVTVVPTSTIPTVTTTTTGSSSTTTPTVPSSTTTTGPPPVPVAPTGIEAIGGPPTCVGVPVTISWPAVANALGYDIFRDGVKIAWPGWPAPAPTSYRDPSPVAGVHSYTVAGWDSAGVGPPSSPVVAKVC